MYQVLIHYPGELRRNGAMVIHVGVEAVPAGVLAVTNPVTETTPAALRQEDGVRVVLI